MISAQCVVTLGVGVNCGLYSVNYTLKGFMMVMTMMMCKLTDEKNVPMMTTVIIMIIMMTMMMCKLGDE